MIKKIKKIKKFGLYKDFDWTDTSLTFKDFNLVYGWNYSGKTTLSRIFRSFEKNEKHKDYLEGEYKIELDDGSEVSEKFEKRINIRVFNSDFVKENLQWDTDNIEPIFLLGVENIELQKELKQKETDLITAEAELAEAKILRQEKLNRINNAVTNKAREVGTLLSIRLFDSRHFLPIVEKLNASAVPFTLNQADFEKYKSQALSNEQKPLIGAITISITDLVSLKNEVEIILHRQAASDSKIQRLLESKPISDWVETGKNLHVGKTECEFCGNTLPVDLLEKLNEHFSKDYDLLKADIEAKLKILTASKIVLSVSLPTETAFYANLLPEFRTKKPLLEKEIENFNDSIASLIKDLENKKDKPFERIELTGFTDNKTVLETALINFNALIKKNDDRTSSFTIEKNAAIEKLKEHFAAEFETNETYSTIQTQLGNEQAKIDLKSVNIESQKQAIILVKSQLDETVKGAELVNDYLKVFFGKDDVKIVPTTDKKFQLLRGAEVAKNLSEGEKTAISFAYFTAKLEEQNNKLSDTIIYIDDPISSLDSNHLFNIYSFIKNTFYERKLDPVSNKKMHIAKCKQLFISTHNFDFHNLVFDWFKERTIGKEKQSFLIIERHKNSHKDESIIKQNSNLLTSFNSEYAYLFSLLHNFQTNPTDTYDFLYHLPNVARRFVETYLSFKYLERNKIDESIEKLIINPVECERARKFMHYNSHNLTTEKVLGFSDLAECIEVVNIILKSVKENDKTHYDSLIGSLVSTI